VVSGIDELVAARAAVKNGQPDDKPLPVVEPDEIGTLLNEIEAFAARYVVFPGESERVALVLWTAHSHALRGSHATPYLLIVSPEKRSGKTRVAEVLELLVARPWRVTGASEAAIFRKIAQDRPSLILDEIDAIFGSYSERTEPLRAILNAGNRPGAVVARCVGEKGDQVRDFPVYCAKCLVGIDRGDRIPDTIRDRAVTIRMRRKTDAEPTEKFRYRFVSGEIEPLAVRLAGWGDAASELLLAADPELPPELDDRAAEAWEALVAIADLAGGEWPYRAREAAVELSGDDDFAEESHGTMLLGAVRDAFGDSDRMATSDLLATINADEELPFGGWRDGSGLDSRRLAKLLRPFGVRPKVIRLDDGTTPRGYTREMLADAWARWLPTPLTEAQQAQQAQQATEAATQEPLELADVADVADVALISGGVAGGGDNRHDDEAAS
jgi:Protein of unknown function (DUF3631)